MKKLLVLALVLSMATIANAGLTLTISGPTQLALGATGTYTVGYTGYNTLASYDVDILSTIGTVGGGVGITTNTDSATTYFGADSLTGYYEATMYNDVALTDLGSPLFSFTLTAPSTTGTATISFLENSFIDTTNTPLDYGTTVLPTLNVQIVPEPMTMGLLGLGGLFLRRRK